jgi:hypothetical protein
MEQAPVSQSGAAAEADLGRQRKTLISEIGVAFPVAIAVWLGVYLGLPPIAGMEEVVARLVLALQCCCLATLFCFLTGIEAVAHERLGSPAIDPLSGFETRRLQINLRYLQNTLEQLVVFAFGLFALAVACADGYSIRAVPAVTLVWILSRVAFWIGYHYGSLHRAAGAPGVMQSLLVLLYVSARFGYQAAGWAGAIAVVLLYGAIEAFLVRATRSR